MKTMCHKLYAIFFGAVISVSVAASNGGYPAKPISLIVPSSPGGALDTTSRFYAEQLSAYLKQPVVVENRPGASSMLGARLAARAEPDGYTLLTGSNTVMVMPELAKNAGYTQDDLVGIGEMYQQSVIFVVSESSPFDSLSDLVAAAKNAPGELTYASGGNGSTTHIPVEMFASEAGVKFTHVPYKAVSGAISDVTSGRVDFMIKSPSGLEEMVRSGRMRALAISGNERSSAFPDVPTFLDLGYDLQYTIWGGVLAPAGIPDAVRSKLGKAMEAARSNPDFVERLERMGQQISNIGTPDQFDSFLHSEVEASRELIKEAGIRAR